MSRKNRAFKEGKLQNIDKKDMSNVYYLRRGNHMKCRITLDEVIAHEREVAKDQKSKYDKCITRMRYDCLMCFYKPKCNEIAEYHEKLAELLEELKILKSLKNCSFITIGKTVEQFEQEIRSKAFEEVIKKMEEQLKVSDGEE